MEYLMEQIHKAESEKKKILKVYAPIDFIGKKCGQIAGIQIYETEITHIMGYPIEECKVFAVVCAL